MPDHRIFGKIRASYMVIQIMEYFGNATHAGATNTGKMNVANAPHEVF